ncbi:MAG: hypothetical protein CMF49_06660 [Legionellales bacterium]|mgnify:CR=1 FL=1|nr:hypothetical protein [Legionellales bacterium]|tara:strand:+ start:1130 stop:1531 length:402 start_codon:yes stop_codon:yes gene_type:complete
MLVKIIIAFVCFIIFDAIWLGFIAKNFYFNSIGHLMRISNGSLSPNWLGALSVYVLLIVGLLTFVLPKAQESLFLAFGYGALFGLVTYGVYDFTNLAVLASWPWKISLLDTLWGSVLCGTTSTIIVLFSRIFS